MDQIKDRYQFIIGFAAVVISLGAFKDELKLITINFVLFSFTAWQYLFVVIASCVLSMHLYIIPYIFNTTRYNNHFILSWIESLSYLIFVVIACSPTILLITYAFKEAAIRIQWLPLDTINMYLKIAVTIGTIINLLLAAKVAKRLKRNKNESEQDELDSNKIKSLEIAKRLLDDNYYSQSLVESVKALEISLFQYLRRKDLVFSKVPLAQMINIIAKNKLLSIKYMDPLYLAINKRNSLAHSTDLQTTRFDAELVLRLVTDVIMGLDKSE